MADILSPLPGVFWSKPGPDKDPFIKVGDEVTVGQTVGMVEVMKQFTEVQSDVAGTVKSVSASDGSMVMPGGVLVVVEPH